MALNHSNNSNLEQLALKGLNSHSTFSRFYQSVLYSSYTFVFLPFVSFYCNFVLFCTYVLKYSL